MRAQPVTHVQPPTWWQRPTGLVLRAAAPNLARQGELLKELDATARKPGGASSPQLAHRSERDRAAREAGLVAKSRTRAEDQPTALGDVRAPRVLASSNGYTVYRLARSPRDWPFILVASFFLALVSALVWWGHVVDKGGKWPWES